MWSASMVSCVFFTIIIVITPASAQRAVTRVKQVAEFTGPSNDIGEFGYSVAINGNLAVVGAPFANYAYLYIKGQAGWSQAARFDDGTNMNGFGWATAASSNVIAVGNPQLRNGGGTVFVFVKPEGGWVSMPATAQLTVPGMQMGLGGSLAISPDGKTIVAGAPAANGMQGETCVFVEPAGGWINVTEATATLTASSSVVSGNSVAMSGNTIVVGNDDPNLGSEVYIFVKPTDGWVSTSQPNAVLTASDETQSDNFGYSVAIDGNTVVVGAPLHPNVGAGTAYVFVKPSGGWQNMTQTAELSINVNHPIGLGVSVAVEGNVILAGAPDDAIGHNNQQGAVFGYIEPAGGWQNTTTTNGSVTAQNGQAKELFGSRLALSGKTFIVGAPDYNGLVGAAYIFQAQ